jgi:hypothetical protein
LPVASTVTVTTMARDTSHPNTKAAPNSTEAKMTRPCLRPVPLAGLAVCAAMVAS